MKKTKIKVKVKVEFELAYNLLWSVTYFVLVDLDQLYLEFAKKIIDVITEPRMIACEYLWRIGRTPGHWEKSNRVPIFKKQ